MRYVKFSITLCPTDAMRQQLQARRIQRLLDEMNEEFGPVPTDVADEIATIAWPTVDGSIDSR